MGRAGCSSSLVAYVRWWCRLRLIQAVSCIGSGQPGLSYQFCEEIFVGYGLAPKIVWE